MEGTMSAPYLTPDSRAKSTESGILGGVLFNPGTERSMTLTATASEVGTHLIKLGWTMSVGSLTLTITSPSGTSVEVFQAPLTVANSTDYTVISANPFWLDLGQTATVTLLYTNAINNDTALLDHFQATITAGSAPTPQFTLVGAPQISGAPTTDFALVEAEEALFAAIIITGMTNSDDARVRFKNTAGGMWIEAPSLEPVVDETNQWATQCGLDIGQVVPGNDYQVEIVERALIGEANELANTKTMFATTRNPQQPAGTRVVNISNMTQATAAWADLQAGDKLVFADGTYALSGTPFPGVKSNIDNVSIVAATEAILDGLVADTYTWTLDSGDRYTTTDITNPADLDIIYVDGSGIARYKTQANLDAANAGFFVNGSTVHIKVNLKGVSRNPNSFTIGVSHCKYGFSMASCDFLYMENITLRGISELNGGTGGTRAKAFLFQGCEDMTLKNVKVNQCASGGQFNGSHARLSMRNVTCYQDPTYLNPSVIKLGSNRFFNMEESGGIWSEGVDPESEGTAIIDCLWDGLPNGLLFVNGAGSFTPLINRRQTAMLIRNFESRNCMDAGIEIDGHNINVLIAQSCLHSSLATLSLSPQHRGPTRAYDCQFQGGWVPGEDLTKTTKYVIQFTFGSSPYQTVGSVILQHCTVVGRYNAAIGTTAWTNTNQNSGGPGGGSTGSYILFQVADNMPFPNLKIQNCIWTMKDGSGGGDPIGWIFAWEPGSAGHTLDSDQVGIDWGTNIVRTLGGQARPFFLGNSQKTLAQAQALFPGRWDDIVDADPLFDANRIPTAAAIGTAESIIGIDLPDQGATRTYQFTLP